MSDFTCLAEGYVFPADFSKTGVNCNEIIVGATGCGKSKSNCESRLLHTTESSVVVPIAKSIIKDSYAEMFRERGYKVIDFDFTNPEISNYGYDPMDYIVSEEDVVQTARNLIGQYDSTSRDGGIDPYWNDSATSVLAAEIAYIRITCAERGVRPSFVDVINLHRNMNADFSGNHMRCSLDASFKNLERNYPGNQASSLWKTVEGLAARTSSCIFSIVNNALDKIFSNDVLAMINKRERIDFAELGMNKCALFITSSPMNTTLSRFINLMYADMFRRLFETAEKMPDYRLQIPVHIICDDFACTSKIVDFEKYISIFRAAGISVSILIQSETQLSSMYGREAATTIINNCDTYVYMGGMDIDTCSNIAKRINKPLHYVLSLPLEKVVICRRGMASVVSRRYQTLEDPIYKELMKKAEARKAKNAERAAIPSRPANHDAVYNSMAGGTVRGVSRPLADPYGRQIPSFMVRNVAPATETNSTYQGTRRNRVS